MDGKAHESVVDFRGKTKEDSLPPVKKQPVSFADVVNDSMRDRMRAKLTSTKYSEETRLEVKGLIDEAVNFLLNREARSLPKAVKRRYLLNVKQYPRKLLKYPDIEDALNLPVIREPLDTEVTTHTTEKEIEEIEEDETETKTAEVIVLDDTATDSEEEKKHRRRRWRKPKPSEPQEKEQDEKKLTLPGLFVNTNLDEEDASTLLPRRRRGKQSDGLHDETHIKYLLRLSRGVSQAATRSGRRRERQKEKEPSRPHVSPTLSRAVSGADVGWLNDVSLRGEIYYHAAMSPKGKSSPSAASPSFRSRNRGHGLAPVRTRGTSTHPLTMVAAMAARRNKTPSHKHKWLQQMDRTMKKLSAATPQSKQQRRHRRWDRVKLEFLPKTIKKLSAATPQSKQRRDGRWDQKALNPNANPNPYPNPNPNPKLESLPE